MPTLFIALGGALGTIARHHLVEWLRPRSHGAMPWGTLTVNLVGSLLIGALAVLALRLDALSPTLRLALTTGVLGGFTTYSAFNADTLALAQRGAWGTALAYVTATVVGGWIAGMLGWLAARAIVGG